MKDFEAKLDDYPFKPFRVHLSDGVTINIVEPGTTYVGASSVLIPSDWVTIEGERRVGRWRTIALSHITQFSDIDEPVSGKRPKPRPGKRK